MEYKYDAKAHYATSHEWARAEGGLIVVGISDYAQDLLSDLVFVDLPEVGATAKAGKAIAVAESVKAAEDVYSPVSGEVVEINEDLIDTPELLNSDPYGAWLFKVAPSDSSEMEALMDASAYETYVKEQQEAH
ncbi:MAG: glycine cleavage system protein GcvH [Caldilineales bacterium]|nr:glycine cleavage system protein GcvH [Caldilineales bacterium]